jgi:hypothetical protein
MFCGGPTAASRTCRDIAACDDGLKNQSETDVDCGGVCASGGNGCAATKACIRPADCASGSCLDGKCAAANCKDGLRNGDEKGVDCGSAACGLCKPGTLIADADAAQCDSGLVAAGLRPIAPEGGFFIIADTSNVAVPESYMSVSTKACPVMTRDWAFCRFLTLEHKVACIPPSAFFVAGLATTRQKSTVESIDQVQCFLRVIFLDLLRQLRVANDVLPMIGEVGVAAQDPCELDGDHLQALRLYVR